MNRSKIIRKKQRSTRKVSSGKTAKVAKGKAVKGNAANTASSKRHRLQPREQTFLWNTHGRLPRPIDNVLSKLTGVTQSMPGQWSAHCPAHADNSPSLSVGEGDDGRVLLTCHTGCEPKHIVKALGLELRDLFLSGR